MLAANEPARLAHLEPYLINEVGKHFRETGKLAAEDFWLILIWKANRAKNNERRRFEKLGKCTFEKVVETIACDLACGRVFGETTARVDARLGDEAAKGVCGIDCPLPRQLHRL